MEFSKQEYGSRLPFSTTGDLPDPEIKHMSPALAGRFCREEMSCFYNKNAKLGSTSWRDCYVTMLFKVYFTIAFYLENDLLMSLMMGVGIIAFCFSVYMTNYSKRKRNLKFDREIEMMYPYKRRHLMRRRMREGEMVCKAITLVLVLKTHRLLLVPSLNAQLQPPLSLVDFFFFLFPQMLSFYCHSGRLENKINGSNTKNADLVRMQSLHFRDQGNTTLGLSVPEPDFHLGYISIRH